MRNMEEVADDEDVMHQLLVLYSHQTTESLLQPVV